MHFSSAPNKDLIQTTLQEVDTLLRSQGRAYYHIVYFEAARKILSAVGIDVQGRSMDTFFLDPVDPNEDIGGGRTFALAYGEGHDEVVSFNGLQGWKEIIQQDMKHRFPNMRYRIIDQPELAAGIYQDELSTTDVQKELDEIEPLIRSYKQARQLNDATPLLDASHRRVRL